MKTKTIFEELNICFDNIEQGINVDGNATMFAVCLSDVCNSFKHCYIFEFERWELLVVQQWIYKLLGNKDISNKTRARISIYNTVLCDMLEELNGVKEFNDTL